MHKMQEMFASLGIYEIILFMAIIIGLVRTQIF